MMILYHELNQDVCLVKVSFNRKINIDLVRSCGLANDVIMNWSFGVSLIRFDP